MENRLDGNAAAGMLQAIFPFDMTSVQVTCAGCGARAMLGTVAAYLHGMGTILRCPFCDTILIRVAQIRGDYWLDMQGTRALQISARA